MKKYPRLTEMGVTHPLQIDRYSVNSIGYTDTLRIVYVRPKGSLLPVSKTYKFQRIQKSVRSKPGAGQTDTVMESNPGLSAALEELENVLEAKEHKQTLTAAILDELSLLEEDIDMRIGYLKMLAGKIHGE